MTPELVKVCSWCEDAAEQTASARAHGYDVTHGLCDKCAAQMRAEFEAEP